MVVSSSPTDDEFSEKELKQIEADDQAIQTILLGLPEDSMPLLIVVKLLRKSGYNVENQVIHNAVQNPRIQNVGNQNGLIGVPGNANQNPNGNGNLVAAHTESNATGHNGIQLQVEEFDLMAAAVDLDEIEEVNANCILMANLQQASTSEAAKFVGDFKSLAKEADESLAKHKALELKIERLLRAVASQDIMSVVQNNSVDETSNLQTELERTKERFENCIIKKENEYAKLWNDWYKKCEEYKFDKISYDKAYNDMQQKIERLQAQLGHLKGMFRINPFKTSREEKHVPNKVKASVRTNPITISQPPVITKKAVNSDSNSLSSTVVDNTAKTKRP
nr:hypothetical protein [Tanacetum cinerariifolium]